MNLTLGEGKFGGLLEEIITNTLRTAGVI